jgi:hypothetical protein
MLRPILTTFALLAASAALAQQQETADRAAGGSAIADLLSKGYEIRAAVPNGTTKFIVFMQKGTSAYACEFFTVTKSRCGSIN